MNWRGAISLILIVGVVVGGEDMVAGLGLGLGEVGAMMWEFTLFL
jgi:hypothetical protein